MAREGLTVRKLGGTSDERFSHVGLWHSPRVSLVKKMERYPHPTTLSASPDPPELLSNLVN